MTPPEEIAYVGHATVRIELDGARLLTDPVLRTRVGPLRRQVAPPARDRWEDLDAVLISHLHHDHADLPSLRRIGRDVPMLAAPGAGEFLGRHGFTAVTELAPGESVRVGEVTVTATEAWHPGGGRFERGSRAVGFLLSGSRRRIYFAGDTDLFDGMEAIGGDDELDFALLPVWGWGPSLGPGHLDPERAARAAALLSPRIAIPIHWGTLYPFGLAGLRPGPLRTPPREFAARVRDLAPQVEVRVLAPGEATSLA
ncbi:MAG TPA: MBL fold metallo-hydrolase [Solirubrobacterales bacterium]